MADVLHVQYDMLQNIAQMFGAEAEKTNQLHSQIRSAAEPLFQGDWQGVAGQAFNREMQSVVFPALDRLESALQQSQSTTLAVLQLIQQAEEEAAALFNGQGGASGPGGAGAGTAGAGGGTAGAGGAAGSGGPASPLSFLLKKLPSAAWTLFKERNLWRGFAGGVRFVKDASGMWRVFGPRAARTAMGLNPFVNRFGPEFVENMLKQSSPLTYLKNMVTRSGPLAENARGLLRSLTTASPVTPVASFMQKVKGPAILSGLISAGMNVYEYGWGANSDKGLGSREFITSTVADVAAGGAIVAASTAIGTLIPIPGVGTAVGFVAGVGLQYLYDNYGKQAWRSAVDGAGQWLQNNVPAAIDSVRDFGHSIANGARDAVNTVGDTLSSAGRGISNAWNSVTSIFG